MSEDRQHLSVSQINTFCRCGEQWRRRYVEGDIVPPNVSLLRGTGVHVGASTNYQQKIESGEDLPQADIVDAAVEGFKARRAAEGLSFTEEERQTGVRKVTGAAIDATARLAKLYADEEAPTVQPQFTEEKFCITLPGDYDLIGVIDVADVEDNVCDLKTSGKSPAKNAAATSLQLTVYAPGFKALTGRWPKEMRLSFLVDNKEPKRIVQATNPTRDDIEMLVCRFNQMVQAIKSGVYTPATPDNWCCSEKWCGYWRTCKYAKR